MKFKLVEEKLNESLYIPDDLKLLDWITNAVSESVPEDENGMPKLTDDEIIEIADYVNEYLHLRSEKKPRTRKRY